MALTMPRLLSHTPRRPPGKPVFGCARAFLSDQLGFLTRVAHEFGDIAYFRLGRERVYLISHPDLIQEVVVTQQKRFKKGRGLERAQLLLGEGLLTSEGEHHLHQRRLAQPAFHRQRIAGYAETMTAYARRHADRWRDGGVVDVHRECMALTMAIAGKTLFDADVERLVYTCRVLAESMRLYPPAWLLARRATAPGPLGVYEIPERAMVFLSPWVTHRDARFFPEPERFDPDRWTPEADAARPRFCYFPFGGGTRRCIGEHFAWLEGVLVLAAIAARWRLRPVAGHPVGLRPSVTLRPAHGMPMIAERR